MFLFYLAVLPKRESETIICITRRDINVLGKFTRMEVAQRTTSETILYERCLHINQCFLFFFFSNGERERARIRLQTEIIDRMKYAVLL